MTETLRPQTYGEGQSAPPVNGRGGVTTLVIGALLGLGVLIVELLYLPMPYPSDQTNYMEGAQQFPHPNERIPVHQFVRFGLVLPMRLAIEVFGYSEAAYFAVPVLTGLLLTLSVYALGTLLFSRAVGAAAAVLAAGNNVVFYDLLQPLPDVLATALFCWALVLTIAIRQQRPSVSATRRRQAVALLGVGALMGWSYLTREYIVFAWPLVPLLLIRRVGWRGLLWVALPLAATGVAELVLNSVAYGDPLARLRATSGHGSGPAPEQIAGTFQDKPRSWYLSRLTHGIDQTPEGPWLKAMLFASVAGGLLMWRRLGLLLAWTALVYVPLVLLGGLLDPSEPMLRLFKMRYWFPLFPAFILGGVALAWLLTRAVAERIPPLRRNAGVVAGAVTLVLAAPPLMSAQTAWNETGGYRVMGETQLNDFRGWLRENRADVDVIWTDQRTAHLIPIYARGPFGGPIWDGEIRILVADGPRPQSGHHVVLFSTQPEPPCLHCRAEAQKALGEQVRPPDDWQREFATGDEQLLVYVVS